ncbi:SNARE-binding exocyst subunit S6 [Purpureocillium takamizusanense]|uniref:SNARE-binding exocyst subunit S6 n=1 Tax=Purpureocillium takamizusanense TaxID=2060973 RepID=A0A9Q8QHW8_9HYPO|nr:SNARE-binding exocyst subunit S6 [Purpureocillium takamizusanense]UNI19975.1 SNARE-binding exocyst subunit S6 [Purpureocillium takamizusanense]
MDDAPAPKLSELLRHPDDLDKIPALKLEFTRKKGAVDGQLRNGLREQLETTQSGMTGLSDGQKTVQMIKDEMMSIDRLCSESQTMIKDFASINLVSQAHRNFGAVEAMRRNLETFNERLTVVEGMLRQDDDDRENMPNLLPCHYELTQLRNIRDDAMEQIQRADDPSLESTLEDYFARLDDTIDWFDEHVGILAMNLINLVVNDNNGLVVRFAVVMEAEERSDQRVAALQEALKDHEEMAVRFQSITDGAKKVRGYKDKFLQAIRLSAEQQFDQARDEFLDDATQLEKIMKWYFNDLNAVKIGMTPLMPKKWRIAKTYADTYHQLMHDFLVGIVEDPQGSSAHTLEIVSFPEKYYKKMAKLGFRQEDLTPHVIDNREAELVRDFRQLIIKFLDEWIDRIFDQEKRDFADRNVEGSNLDQDEYGYFRTKNLVALWRMLREQVEAGAGSKRTDVVEGVVDAMFLRLRARQQAWQRLLEDEALRYESLSAGKMAAVAAAAAGTGTGTSDGLDGFQALQDWLVATANDQIACIDDNEEENRLGYLSSFRQMLEPHVSPPYLERADHEVAALRDGYVDFSTWCITKFAQLVFAVDFKTVMPDFFTPRWYPNTAMKQMVVTFEEYVNDYRQVLHHSLVDIFTEIFADELLVHYLSAVRNKGARFRRADPFRDKLFNDISTAFELFNNLPNPDVGQAIKQTWRATEPFLRLLSADKDAVPDEFAAFKSQYWDLQISWVEAVLRARDDFDRAMLNAVKARAAQMDVTRGPETIMSKVK